MSDASMRSCVRLTRLPPNPHRPPIVINSKMTPNASRRQTPFSTINTTPMTKPMMAPPAREAAVPGKERAPFVPGGTGVRKERRERRLNLALPPVPEEEDAEEGEDEPIPDSDKLAFSPISNLGFPFARIPSSEASVSPRQQAKCPRARRRRGRESVGGKLLGYFSIVGLRHDQQRVVQKTRKRSLPSRRRIRRRRAPSRVRVRGGCVRRSVHQRGVRGELGRPEQ